MNLLLIADDVSLTEAICDGIRKQAWSVEHVNNGRSARCALLDHAFSAVLLDIDEGVESARSVLRWLRGRRDSTPVLIITANSRLSERIQWLDSGADDYLIKPFELDDLLARIRAVTRRSQGRVVDGLRCGDVSVDPEKRIVTRCGERVGLSVHEYRTLLAFIERPGRVVTRDHLERVIYGSDGTLGSNTIAVFIHQLRRKLGAHIIATVHGHGYMLGESR